MSSTRRETKAQRSIRTGRANPPQSAAAGSATVNSPRTKWWPWLLALLIATIAVFEIYGPAMNGPFLLDDSYLPYSSPEFAHRALSGWLVGARPLLNLSFWVNYQWSQQDTFTYHLLNVVLHVLNGALVFSILLRILEKINLDMWTRRVLSGFGAALFLVHPLQTESVAYVASRSETLSVFFVYLAFALFLWRRREEISWPWTAAVLAAFIAACLSKEHTVILPALLLLTDYFWNPGFSLGGIKRNWRLYIPLALAAALGAAYVLRVLSRADTAGFGMKDLTWYQYFFTQCRAIWVYLAKFVLPINQNIDYDFAISRTILDHGSILGMLALIGVSVAAWIFRKRFPLASYGLFVFLILIAPTSSFAPIRDPLVERRLYLPFIGLLFIVIEFLRRWRTSRTVLVSTLAVVIGLESLVAYNRNQLWGDAMAMWRDSTSKSPGKERPEFQLGSLYYSQGRCGEAADTFAKARMDRPDDALLLDWGLALECAGRGDEALVKIRQAVSINPNAHSYTQLAMVYARHGQYPAALEVLDLAAKIDPRYDLIYYYRGTIALKQGNAAGAVNEYRLGLALNPNNSLILDALPQAERAAGMR